MTPAQVQEVDFSGRVFQDKSTPSKGLLRPLHIVLVQIANVLPFSLRCLPTRGFVAIHLFCDFVIGKRGCARCRPQRVAVGMIAVGMGIEDIAHRLWR